MNQNKNTLIYSRIIEKVQLCVGAFLVFVFGLGTISVAINKSGLEAITIFGIFTGLGIWLIVLSNKRKKLINDFTTYVARLSMDPTGSIENLAQSLGMSQDVVINNLQKMIIKKYFVNAYIDSLNNRIVLEHAGDKMNSASDENASNEYNQNEEEYVSVTCKNCGGINKVAKEKVGECEYCGSPITIER
jgi:DNA-directed RNA polymerase subunit RPC12/RpoP